MRLDDGSEMATKTRTPAWLVAVDRGRGYPLVSVEGKAGGWSLERVTMIETEEKAR